MEREYKWRATEEVLGSVLLWASARIGSQSRTIQMHSRYFDTDDGLLRGQGVALRLRTENEQSVCCMKLRDVTNENGLRAHEEYECGAVDIAAGLAALPAHGAPEELCRQAAQAELHEQCAVDFSRVAILLQQEDTVCELALDKGELRRGGRTAPLCEIELELIVGDEDVFHALAAELAGQVSLTPEPQSKLARAMAL